MELPNGADPVGDADLSSAMPVSSPSTKGEFWLADSRCTDTLFAPLQDPQCFAQVLSACLSLGVLVGGSLVKLPQLLKIIRARGVEGLAELSVYVEAISAAIFVVYNVLEQHPFTTWGEMLFVSFQNLWILLLFWYYRPARRVRLVEADAEAKRAKEDVTQHTATTMQVSTFTRPQRVLGCLSFLLLATTFGYGYCVAGTRAPFSRKLATALGLAPFPLLFVSRLPQIKQNWSQKHTGQLSAITGGLMLCGNLARLFTSLVSLSDRFVTMSCTLATILNAIPLFQIFWYRHNTVKVLAETRSRAGAVQKPKAA